MQSQKIRKPIQPNHQHKEKIQPDIEQDNSPLTSAEFILQLQRTVGNQAVLRMLANGNIQAPTNVTSASVNMIQRKKSSTGLGKSSLINDFAKAALDYWRDDGNKDKPLTDFGDYLISDANTKLQGLGVPNCLHSYTTSGSSRGTFGRTTWSIELNTDEFSDRIGITKVGDLNQYEVSQIARTLYHEPRHAEQYFRIARMQAGEGKSAAQIENDMNIPPNIAAAAFASPLTGDTKANRKLIKEAKAWEAITVGKYGEYKNETNWLDDQADEMVDIIDAYDPSDKQKTIDDLEDYVDDVNDSITNTLEPILTKINTIKKKDDADKSVRKHIKNMKKTFEAFKAEYDKTSPNIRKLDTKIRKFSDATYTAYTKFQHEQDTRAIHNAVIASFNKQAKKKKK